MSYEENRRKVLLDKLIKAEKSNNIAAIDYLRKQLKNEI